MNDLRVTGVSTPAFSAAATRDGAVLVLELWGNADSRVVEALSALLPQIHAEALRLGAPEVVVDFRGLEFMISSCFKAFVAWLGRLREHEGPPSYTARFRLAPTIHWQRRSIEALSQFAVGLVHIEREQE
jgi:anti-anti-sigma regulatory factor